MKDFRRSIKNEYLPLFFTSAFVGVVLAIALCITPALVWWPILAFVLIAMAKGMER